MSTTTQQDVQSGERRSAAEAASTAGEPKASTGNWTPEWLKQASPSAVVAMDEHRERSEAPPTVPHEVTR